MRVGHDEVVGSRGGAVLDLLAARPGNGEGAEDGGGYKSDVLWEPRVIAPNKMRRGGHHWANAHSLCYEGDLDLET